jgi:hypothetical protein
MKVGRNDPCSCGSGKKYKKCCLAKDQSQTEASLPSLSARSRPVPFPTPHSQPAGPTSPSHGAEAATPATPPDPITLRAESRWREFESQPGEGQIAVFLETLGDAEVMTDDLAFEMLGVLHTQAVESSDRTRFVNCVEALRRCRPEVFDQGSHFYLSWCVVDALAENRQEVVLDRTRELATRANRDIDTFNRVADALGYHGQLSVLVEALRMAWPGVKSSDNILPWGISEFANRGADHEIFDFLGQTTSVDPADPVLLDRVRFFIEEPREDSLREFIGDLTGQSTGAWRTEDFALRPPRQRGRDDWDDDAMEEQPPDPGAINLSRLIAEFVGYLRREDGVPFARGDLVRQELERYFVRRHEGGLDPQPNLLEQARHPNRRLPKPPRPAHPLCPERVTLDVHLGGLMGPMNGRYYRAAALFQAMPAWLRFLETRRLIDAGTRTTVAHELLPLHATLMGIWKKYADDPSLDRQQQAWPADVANELPQSGR